MQTLKKDPYISEIRIEGLRGSLKVKWPICRGVNIISGVNGSGKSTILRAVCDLLKNGAYNNDYLKPIDNIEIVFENGTILSSLSAKERKSVANIDVISTFDSSMLVREAVQKLTDNKVKTELDWELYRTVERYIRYQLMVGKKAINMLLDGSNVDLLKALVFKKDMFFDIVDELFKDTGKKIIREKDEIAFDFNGIELSPYQLSSGEKQIMIILTTVLTQNDELYILIMDEPEISLHFEWQKSLLENIVKLNPNVQVLTSTHSPAMIMQGWMSRVKDVDELIFED